MVFIVNSLAVLVIVFIIVWFWLMRPQVFKAKQALIEIIVEDGVYKPANIEIEKNKPVILRFMRKDPAACTEAVVFDGLSIRLELPLDKAKHLALNIDQAGEYTFTCDMQMYRGRLLVK